MPPFLRKFSDFSALCSHAQPSVTVGAGWLPLQVPLKPKVTEPPLGTLPFQEALEQLTCCPAPNVQVTRQEESEDPAGQLMVVLRYPMRAPPKVSVVQPIGFGGV
jgi:hypothetical protein